jgi:ferrous-iron efflux pump FieF
VLDSLASIVNFLAVRHALTPADKEHRFGHGKAEPLAGLGQAAFIAGSSLLLLFEAVKRLANPVPVEHGAVGIAVMVISLALTLALVTYQRHVVRRTGSLAVSADALHYASDIVLNASVIIAIMLSTHLGWDLADPLFGIAIAGYIVHAAWRIARDALDQLMDRELPDEDRRNITEICLRHAGVRDIHELRTRASGRDIFIQLHLVLQGDMPLATAHRISEDVQRDLLAAYPGADVIIHEDPLDDSRPEP